MTSTLPAFILLGGLTVVGLVLIARWLEGRHWARLLSAFRLHLPGDLTAEDVARWLANVGAATHPPLWSLLPMPPVELHAVGSPSGISHYLLVSEGSAAKMLAGLRATMPGVRIEATPGYLARQPAFRVAAEVRLTSQVRPLALDRADSASAALLSAMQPIGPGCEIRLVWTLTSAGTPTPTRRARSGRGNGSVSWWLESRAPENDDERAERIKNREPLLRGVARLGVVASSKGQAYKLFGRVWPMLHAANAPGVRVVRRWLPSSVVARRMINHAVPLSRWPVVANAVELSGLLALPIGGVHLPGLRLGASRQLPPPTNMPSRGAVVGLSNYTGTEGQLVALKPKDRLQHSYILGPTGTGKSVLITRLVLQDLAQGYGAAVFDPKGDLVTDILARIPPEQREKVVLLDAHDRSHPVGFNILGNVTGEAARELTVDNVLHIFRSIWSDFWGPRTDQILRTALSTLTLARAADGSAFTICELPSLLTNASFRQSVVQRANLPHSLRDYWQRFESWSEPERVQAVSPVLNKVDAFVQRVPIALMLGQSRGISFSDVFRERKLLLVSLAKGSLGAETGNLLGSLLVASLWQATLSRVQVPAEQRRPFFAYIDEAQDLMRLPLALPDMLAQARGMGLGITMATQYLAQLPEAIKSAVLGTVRTTLAFAVDYDDAKVLERRFAPLTADDLMGLSQYEAALRPCLDGQTLSPVTLKTLPPDPVLGDAVAAATHSRGRFGVLRAEVEQAMRDRLQFDGRGDDFGRQRRSGGRS